MTDERQQRRLTTILAADVFGYSRLTAENEEDTLRTLKAHRAVINRLIERHDGRIFNTAGDSVLAEFGSAVEAVRCAITIQEELRVRNAQIAENRRMLFRIGVNVGDVLVDGDNLYGDGINVAARLESIAEPGNICISGSVFALVKNKLSYGFEDIGPQTVKNIPDPVPAFRLIHGSGASQVPVAVRSSRRWALPVVAGVAALAIAAAGVYYWTGRGGERVGRPVDVPPAAGPAQPDTAALERMRPFAGMTVHGISTVNGKPFVMPLDAGGAAVVKIEAASGGRIFEDRGRWWIAPNGRFCIQYTRFAGGNRVCREQVTEDGVVKAYTGDRQPNPWVFKK
jgi:class 3 adenylate cyclase